MLGNALWIAIGVLHVLAIVDIWVSLLSRPARVLWTITILCLPIIGLGSWLITRGSAHQPEEQFADVPDEA